MKELTEEDMENMSLDELQFIMDQMNLNKKIDNDKFEMFQALLEKDINITTDIN